MGHEKYKIKITNKAHYTLENPPCVVGFK